MQWYEAPLPLVCVCLFTTLVVAIDGSNSDIQNQKGSSLGFDHSLATIRECVDSRRECSYWRCTNKHTRKMCPKKCGLCKPIFTTTPSTTHFSSTIKTPSMHFSTMARTASATKISTKEINTPKEEPVTTRLGFQTTILMHNTVIPETTSNEMRLTEKPRTTNQKSTKSLNAYTKYSKSGFDVTMVTSIAVSCLFVLAIAIFLLIFKWRKRRSASLMHEPETIISMQPFNYTREKPCDSSRSNATRIYEELHGNKGTRLTSHKKTSDLNNDEPDEPFYYVLERNTQNEHLYACADAKSHLNKAFDSCGQTVHSQSRPEGAKYETITFTSAHKNKATQDDRYCKDGVNKPYYHVEDKKNSKYQGDCKQAPIYQPLIGVKRDANGNTVDRCSVYQPLTGIRSKGARMS